MTTAIEVTLPWGRYHATPWDRNVNEAHVEWPPSPWRLVRTFYSAWKNRCPDLPASDVLPLLDRLSAPPRYSLPSFTVAHTRHYYPGPGYTPGVGKADTDKTLDPFVLTERGARFVVDWPDVELDQSSHDTLRRLVDEIGYIGRADTIVDCRVIGDIPSVDDWTAPGERSSHAIRLLAPAVPLDERAITTTPFKTRQARRLMPEGTMWVEYPAPTATTPMAATRRGERPRVLAARFAITGNALPARFATVSLGDLLREAALSRYGEQNDGGRSSILAGKDEASSRLTTPHSHAHYFAFHGSSVGHRSTDQKLVDSLVIWSPHGFDVREQSALAAIDRIAVRPGLAGLAGRILRIGFEGFGPITELAPDLVSAASTRWVSYTPYAPSVRHYKGSLAAQLTSDIDRELANRGLPGLVGEVEVVVGDSLSYHRHRPTKERLRDNRRAFSVRIELGEPTPGPLALGQLSHFGLGLFVPAVDDA